LTPVLSGHVLSEIEKPSRLGRIQAYFNLERQFGFAGDAIWAGIDGQQQDLIAGRLRLFAFFGLVYLSVRRGLSVPGTGTASPRRVVRPPR
jgi:hypothetical protein